MNKKISKLLLLSAGMSVLFVAAVKVMAIIRWQKQPQQL